MSYKHNKAWRKRNNSIWQKGKQRYYKQFEAKAYNRYQRYTIREINIITDKKCLDRDIAKKIGRSVKSIQVKRAKLNNFKKSK